MTFDRLRQGSAAEQRHRTWSKLRILVAALGTLSAAAGIAVVVYGLVQFNNTKVITGVAMIVISTIIYVTILARDRDRID
jgi:negative regulator of sigma E activity